MYFIHIGKKKVEVYGMAVLKANIERAFSNEFYLREITDISCYNLST